jgi:glutaminyl-peptide cyclotransferase
MNRKQLLLIIPVTLGLLVLGACQMAASTGRTEEQPAAAATTSATETQNSTTEPGPPPTATERYVSEASSTPVNLPSTTFDGQRAFELLVRQTEFGFRPTGSAAGWATGDWIIEQLEAAGWKTETQIFDYQGVTARNIVGISPSAVGKPVIILGAHYDTRRQADQDPENPREPVLGANDGASGTAVLLELASSLDLDRTPYQVWLAFFDAEDNGNLDGWDWIVGSSYMASRLTIEPKFVIVVDMVGDRNQQIFYEHNSDPELMSAIWSIAAELGYIDSFIPTYRHAILDDHIPFARLGIPAVDIIDFDYPYWHTTGDTVDKVSAESLERVGRTLETFLETARGLGEINE